jgi:TP901 family phage tail tape measure protein
MPDRDIQLRVTVVVNDLQALDRFATLLQRAAAGEKILSRAAIQKNKSLQKQHGAMLQDSKATQSLNRSVKGLSDTIAHNIEKVLQWTIATTAVIGSLRMMRNAVEDIVEVDYAIAGLSKVLNDSGDRARRLSRDLQDLGVSYAELGSEVITGATEWARLQLQNYEILEATRASLLAQAVAEMEVVDATKYLIAAIKQFNEPAIAAVGIIDQWNELSNKFAVRAVDLAQGVARSGAVARNAGMELQQLNGYITALTEATGRSGRELGNAIRTMGVYAYRAETMATLQNMVNINIRGTQDNLMGLNALMERIVVSWGAWTDVQRRSVAQSIAGTRRQAEFIALIENFDTALLATAQAWDSVNSAENEAVIYLDTVRKRLDMLASQMERLVSEGGELAQMFKGLLAMISGTVEILRRILPLLTALAAAWMLQQMHLWATNVALTTFTATLVSTAGAIAGLTALLVIGAYAWGNYLAKQQASRAEAQRQADSAVEELRSREEQAKRVKLLAEQYATLRKVMESGRLSGGAVADEKRLQETEKRLNAIRDLLIEAGEVDPVAFGMGQWQQAIDDIIVKYDELLGVYGEEKKTRREEYRAELGDLERNKELLEAYRETLRDMGDDAIHLDKRITTLFRTQAGLTEANYEALRKVLRAYGLLNNQLSLAGHMEYLEGLEALDKVLQTIDSDMTKVRSKISALTDVTATGTDDLLDTETAWAEIQKRLAEAGEEYRHVGALAKFVSSSQEKQARIALAGTEEQIRILEAWAVAQSENVELAEKIEKALVKLRLQRVKNQNELITAGMADRKKELSETISHEQALASIRSQATARIQEQTKGVLAGAEARMRVLEGNVQRQKEYIAALNEENREAGAATDQLKLYEAQLEAAKSIYSTITVPMQDYSDAIMEIDATERRSVALMEASGANRVALAQIAVDAAEMRLQAAREAGKEELVKSRELELQAAKTTGRIIAMTEEQNRSAQMYQANLALLTNRQALNMAQMQEQGKLEHQVAKQRVDDAKENLRYVLRHRKQLGGLWEQMQAVAEAAQKLALAQAALSGADRARSMELLSEEIELLQNRHDREIEMMEATGASRQAIAERRTAQLIAENARILNNEKATVEEKRQANIDLYTALMDVGHNYELDEIDRSRRIAEAYVSQHEQIRKSWVDAVASMSTNNPLDILKRQMDRIHTAWMGQWVEENLGGVLEGFAGAEGGFAKTKAELRAEEAQHERLVDAHTEGGENAKMSIIDGHTEGIEAAIRGVRKSLEAAGIFIKESIEEGGEEAGETIKENIKEAVEEEEEPGKLADFLSNKWTQFAYGNLMNVNLDDWLNKRGGGVRGGAYAAGTAIGTIATGSPQAGLMIGTAAEAITAQIQDIWSDIRGEQDRDRRRGPREETLQSQLGASVARGQFGEAANVTYFIENNQHFDFFIPDAAQMQRAIPILYAKLEEYKHNVMVGV